jgi:hypothetical protein
LSKGPAVKWPVLLECSIKHYVTALEMMELLLELSHDVNRETEMGNNLGEKAFCDALIYNQSALNILGGNLLLIAKEFLQRVKKSATTDWTVRQSAKDRVKLEVKRVLRFHKYPPDDEVRATDSCWSKRRPSLKNRSDVGTSPMTRGKKQIYHRRRTKKNILYYEKSVVGMSPVMHNSFFHCC